MERTSLYPHSLSCLRDLGYNVGVGLMTQDGLEKIEPQANGFLGSFHSWVSLEFHLIVKIPRNLNSHAVTVNGRQRRIDEKTFDQTPGKPYAIFSKAVKNRSTRYTTSEGLAVLSTKHEGNNLRIVIAENGIFQMWEIAIVTRIKNIEIADYYLTVQKLYEGRMFNYNGEVYIPESDYPGYKRWPDLQILLLKIVDLESLQKIRQPLVEVKHNNGHDQLSENEGVAIFFCLASGLGVARTDQGIALAHWLQIQENSGFVLLEEGQRFLYETINRDGYYPRIEKIYPL